MTKEDLVPWFEGTKGLVPSVVEACMRKRPDLNHDPLFVDVIPPGFNLTNICSEFGTMIYGENLATAEVLNTRLRDACILFVEHIPKGARFTRPILDLGEDGIMRVYAHILVPIDRVTPAVKAVKWSVVRWNGGQVQRGRGRADTVRQLYREGDGPGVSVYVGSMEGMTDESEAAILSALNRPQVAGVDGPWQDISTFDREKMKFVLVQQDEAVRLYLWNRHFRMWERPYPIGSIVMPGEDCSEPTRWMEIPEDLKQGT